jgi:hypothetical protein
LNTSCDRASAICSTEIRTSGDNRLSSRRIACRTDSLRMIAATLKGLLTQVVEPQRQEARGEIPREPREIQGGQKRSFGDLSSHEDRFRSGLPVPWPPA